LDGPVNALLPRAERLLALVDEAVLESSAAGPAVHAWPAAEGVSAMCAAPDGRLLLGGVNGNLWWATPPARRVAQ
jgi:hypothetical protein